MKFFNKYIFLPALTGCIAFTAHAQVDTALSLKTKLSIAQYLNMVGKENLGYAAQRYNVNIAEAGIESAKVFPDPQLSFDGYNDQHQKLGLAYGFDGSISTTLELGGKRRARIDLAKSQTELSKALLLDFFRNLRADAAIAYYNAIQEYYLLQVQNNSYLKMKQLADADSIRFKLGEIMEIDARQSKLDAGNFLTTVFQNEADWKTSLVQLNFFAGKKSVDTLLVPNGNFENLERDFTLGVLITNAQNNRADIVAALNSKTVADKNLALVNANRTIDLGVSVGVGRSSESTNNIAPTPPYTSTTAGLSIPLKFSNHYKGDIKAAQFTINQAEVQYEQVLQQIQVEVTQAYFNYKAAQKQVQQYKSGLLTEAEKVLNGKIYSYKRGQTSLLEVLDAQRTYNDVQQSYYQSLNNYASTLITLERTAGIWDIQ
jgi:cobalt-zinc-cadmium efflux system outer membrane protein